MINRTMVRTKVLQTAFAYYKTDFDQLDDAQNGLSLKAKKDLLKSYSDTYSLYMLLLSLPDEFVALAEQQVDVERERARVMHESYNPSMNFITNRFASQVFNNRTLRAYLDEQHLRWDVADASLRKLFRQLTETDYYQAYQALQTTTYDDDRQLWRKIYSDLLPGNPLLEEALDELEVELDSNNWVTDMDVVLTYVVKTIKRFKEEKKADQELLEMFDSEDELNFGKMLLQKVLDNHEMHSQLIDSHLKNWDASRVAYMDRIILEVALAEILHFPTIALEVSLNEYVELAKEYSGEKSYIFVNGLLDEIVKTLKKENRLIKAVML